MTRSEGGRDPPPLVNASASSHARPWCFDVSPDPVARRRVRRGRVVPTSTYRLQLRPEFGFSAAAAAAPYLARLGVSHVYTSPYLQAAYGSGHGYDVVDPRKVNTELGGSRAHRRFGVVLGQNRLGQVLDLVPNHMAIPGRENPWWWDVLENGQASRYARYFDVDWDPPEAYLRNLVLLPVLGDQYGRVLESGEIRLERRGAEFVIRYHEHLFPVGPRSLAGVLAAAAARARSDELAFLADAHESLPSATRTDGGSTFRRHRDKEVLRDLLARALLSQPRAVDALDASITTINADPDALDDLMSQQHYRLAHWHSAGRDLGYRRFFDVATLIGLRVEDDAVFQDSHGLVLKWIADGVLDGLRVDHPDGLSDPAGYVRRLRSASPRGWLIVEKILRRARPSVRIGRSRARPATTSCATWAACSWTRRARRPSRICSLGSPARIVPSRPWGMRPAARSCTDRSAPISIALRRASWTSARAIVATGITPATSCTRRSWRRSRPCPSIGRTSSRKPAAWMSGTWR